MRKARRKSQTERHKVAREKMQKAERASSLPIILIPSFRFSKSQCLRIESRKLQPPTGRAKRQEPPPPQILVCKESAVIITMHISVICT